MTTLTPELKEAYADAIGVLFNGVVTANPEDITPTVVEYVDTMLKEITKCSAAIVGLLEDMVGVIYNYTLSEAVGNIIYKIRDDYAGKMAASAVNHALKESFIKMVNALTSNKQFVGCINTARANWRSAITIELMGI